MAKKDNIINFRDYQPGKRETIETNSLDEFRETLYDLGFLGPSSSDTLDESKEVEPKVEETEHVSASEVVEEPTVEVEVEETEAVEEPAIVDEDDSDEEVIIEADFREVDFDPEESSSEFEEEIPVSRRKRHKHAAPSGAGARFLKKLGTSFADKILANFGFNETSDSQHEKKVETETKKEEKKASSSKSENHQFSSPLQKLLTEEIMSGNLSRLEEWIENKNVNRLTFLFSNNQVLSDWVQENETDMFLSLPDEVFNCILKKDKEDPEKKDDKDEKKS